MFTSVNAHGFCCFSTSGSQHMWANVLVGHSKRDSVDIAQHTQLKFVQQKTSSMSVLTTFFLSLISVDRVYHYFANVADAQSCWLHHLFTLSSNLTKNKLL